MSKFLEFNGKNIVYINKDGVYHVAIKPICEALNVDPKAQLKRIKNDPILGSWVSIQTLRIPIFRKKEGALVQGIKMAVLPEMYIYGWIFSINSDSKELIKYKMECYKILFNHFNGTITYRKELLKEKVAKQSELEEAIKNLEENKDFKKYNEVKGQIMLLGKSLKDNDKQVMQSQTEMNFN